MATMQSCPKCGNLNEIPDDATGVEVSCMSCGKLLTILAAPVSKHPTAGYISSNTTSSQLLYTNCPQCNARILASASGCPECGTTLTPTHTEVLPDFGTSLLDNVGDSVNLKAPSVPTAVVPPQPAPPQPWGVPAGAMYPSTPVQVPTALNYPVPPPPSQPVPPPPPAYAQPQYAQPQYAQPYAPPAPAAHGKFAFIVLAFLFIAATAAAVAFWAGLKFDPNRSKVAKVSTSEKTTLAQTTPATVTPGFIPPEKKSPEKITPEIIPEKETPIKKTPEIKTTPIVPRKTPEKKTIEPEPVRPFVSSSVMVKNMLSHLNRVPLPQRRYQRFFTVVHLHNNKAMTEAELEDCRLALVRLMNNLGGANPIPDDDRLIYRVDTKAMGWDVRQAWKNVIAKNYPYGLTYESNEALQEAYGNIAKATMEDIPWVHADWFIATASRPPMMPELGGAVLAPDAATVVGNVTRRYSQPVDLDTVTSELGLEDSASVRDALKSNLMKKLKLDVLGRGDTISRQAWTSLSDQYSPYQKLARALQIGARIRTE